MLELQRMAGTQGAIRTLVLQLILQAVKESLISWIVDANVLFYNSREYLFPLFTVAFEP